MAYTLFYIVGNSDVQVPKLDIKGNNFQITEKIFHLLEKPGSRSLCRIDEGKIHIINVKNDFSIQVNEGEPHSVECIEFPIWSALWRELKNKPDQIVLIATDQRDPEFKSTDTLFAAKILERYLQWAKLGSHVDIETVEDNPSDYDQMADYFKSLLKKYEKQISTNIANYLSLSSGTPALIQCLSMAAMPFPFEYYYVPRKQPEAVKQIYHYKNVYRSQYASQLSTLIQSFHYPGARRICEMSPFRNTVPLITLLRAMEARWLYDWPLVLQRVHELPGDYRPDFEWISHIQEGNRIYELLEVMARIETAASYKDIPVLLAYFFNALETARQLLLEKYCHVRLKKEQGKFGEWNDYLKSCGFFTDPKAEEMIAKDPNRKTILRVLECFHKHAIENGSVKDASLTILEQSVLFLKKVEKEIDTSEGKKCIQDLRNSGPFAHGFSSAGETIIQQLWPPYGLDGLVNELRDFINLLSGNQYTYNPFSTINQKIEKLLL